MCKQANGNDVIKVIDQCEEKSNMAKNIVTNIGHDKYLLFYKWHEKSITWTYNGTMSKPGWKNRENYEVEGSP